jgi:hypothetical protein
MEGDGRALNGVVGLFGRRLVGRGDRRELFKHQPAMLF